MLGHELLGPVAPIDNAVAAAKAHSAGNEHVVQLLTIAQRQIRRVRTVMDELLDAARLQHDKLRLELRGTSLKGIVSDAILSVEHRLRLRAQTLTVSGLDDDLVVRADDVRLSQVVGNLHSNSVRYRMRRRLPVANTWGGPTAARDLLRHVQRRLTDDI
ncbi:hypothetical protein SB861_43455 [Paraburkholderia sp. SIMBA_049]